MDTEKQLLEKGIPHRVHPQSGANGEAAHQLLFLHRRRDLVIPADNNPQRHSEC